MSGKKELFSLRKERRMKSAARKRSGDAVLNDGPGDRQTRGVTEPQRDGSEGVGPDLQIRC